MLQMSEQRRSNENASKGVFAGDREGAFSDSFISFVASVLNTPIVLIDPETNHNGIVLLDVNVAETSAAAVPFFAVISHSRIPASVNDGAVILAANQIGSAAGNFTSSGTLDNKIYIPPNSGLYLFPLVASALGVRQGVFRRL